MRRQLLIAKCTIDIEAKSQKLKAISQQLKAKIVVDGYVQMIEGWSGFTL